MLSVCIVSATRHDEAGFYNKSALGRSLRQAYRGFPVKHQVAFRNSRPLAAIYNEALSGNPDDIVVFVHDDVLLVDFFWLDRIEAGFAHFDILGVAGNTRRLPRQASWYWLDDKLTPDNRSYLSGVIGHGQGFPCELSLFGVTGQRCKLLDGVLLAIKRRTLKRTGIRFDEQFPFHFYDVDFCRQAEQARLRMGTIPLPVVHESIGNATTPEWRAAYQRYLAKWKV
jgi:GT2 family glycosyltransferase